MEQALAPATDSRSRVAIITMAKTPFPAHLERRLRALATTYMPSFPSNFLDTPQAKQLLSLQSKSDQKILKIRFLFLHELPDAYEHLYPTHRSIIQRTRVFTPFSKLPNEVRSMIWIHSMPPGRAVNIANTLMLRHNTWGQTYPRFAWNTLPKNLFVCRQSAAEVLGCYYFMLDSSSATPYLNLHLGTSATLYNFAPLRPAYYKWRQQLCRSVCFNPNKDRAYITCGSLASAALGDWFRRLESQCPGFLSSIQVLEIRAWELHWWPFTGIRPERLLNFPNCKEFHFVLDQNAQRPLSGWRWEDETREFLEDNAADFGGVAPKVVIRPYSHLQW